MIDPPTPRSTVALAERLTPIDPTALAVTRQFGLDAAVDRLGSEAAQVYRITASDAAYILKVRSRRVEATSRFQAAAMSAVALRAPALPIPRIVRSTDGRLVAVDRDLPDCTLELSTWLAGIPLAEADPSPGQLEAFGRLLGEVDRALQDVADAAADHDSVWDLAKGLSHADHVNALASGAERDMVAATFADFRARHAPDMWQTLPRQVTHGDASPHNVGVRPTLPGGGISSTSRESRSQPGPTPEPARCRHAAYRLDA